MAESEQVLERLRRVAPTISVGMLTADLLDLGSEIGLLEKSGVEILHFDVMDGCFCPMLTVGPSVVKAVRTSLLKDVHLMIEDPLDKLEPFVAAGADMITVHVEACRHPHRVLQALGTMVNANDASRGIARGVALNPGTPVETVEPLLPELDMILLLAVNPGWSGQKFAESTPARMEKLLEMLRGAKTDAIVAVDGGVTKGNIEDVARIAADVIVTGSAVFDGKDAEKNARYMLEAVARAHKVS